MKTASGVGDLICPMEGATDEVREASRRHASDSPVPGGGRVPERPGHRRRMRRSGGEGEGGGGGGGIGSEGAGAGEGRMPERAGHRRRVGSSAACWIECIVSSTQQPGGSRRRALEDG